MEVYCVKERKQPIKGVAVLQCCSVCGSEPLVSSACENPAAPATLLPLDGLHPSSVNHSHSFSLRRVSMQGAQTY